MTSSSLETVLQTAHAQGIQLWVEEGKLRFRAPQGAMTADLRAQLQTHKEALLVYLASNPAINQPNPTNPLTNQPTNKQTLSIPRLPDQADYELSAAQWRLWVLMQMEDSSVAYNVPLYQLLLGQLDLPRLQAAWDKLAERHEALRTAFVVREGEARQEVSPVGQVRVELELVDVSGEADPEEAARSLAVAEAQTAFDLTVAPLCRVKVVRLGAERHALLLTLHHLICDGVSIGVLNREMAQWYAAPTLVLPPLAWQYRDYAAWQRGWLQGAEAERGRAYWLGQLAGELPVLNLPTDFPRPVVQSFHGREQLLHLPPAQLSALKQLARQEGATLFMLLLASVQTLLHKYSQQTNFIIGTPVAARPHAEAYEQVGFYLNSLPLRGQIQPTDSFRQVLAQAKQVVTGGLEWQLYPFDQMVSGVAQPRDLSRSPLFDVMLILQNQADAGVQLGG
jgi:hypothetical protein